jgi:predicted peroxiredoxin
MKLTLATLGLCGLALIAGCDDAAQTTQQSPGDIGPQLLFFNITSGADEDAHAVTMALQLASHALNDGRDAVLFFNVRGAGVPTTALPEDLAFHEKPIKQLLTELVQRGAEVHVCPHCMSALEIDQEDLIAGAVVTDREKLFSKLGPNTSVFSY